MGLPPGQAYQLASFCAGFAERRPWHRPPLLRRWTKDSGWAASLTPPAGSGAFAIRVESAEVTDGGQTVFALGTLLYMVRRRVS